MEALTVKELIEILKDCPEDAPVFGYNDLDEGDCCIQTVECVMAPPLDEEEGTLIAPHYCKADSAIYEFWQGKFRPVVILRPKFYSEF